MATSTGTSRSSGAAGARHAGANRLLFWLALGLALLWLAAGCHHTGKPLPPGLDAATPLRGAQDVALLADYTFLDGNGERHTDQAIFDEMLALITQARRLVVLDMFLFNDFAGETGNGLRPLSAELTRTLIERRQAEPALTAVLITDPFNTLYGGVQADHLVELERAGVRVILTDLDPLRDSNPGWSSLWRLCCRWFGNNHQGGWLPNPVGPGRVTLRSYLTLLNFKANHRKTLVVDQGDDWVGLVTSANPHDASSAHGNVALRFRGAAALDLLHTELPVMTLSGFDPSNPVSAPQPATAADAADGQRLQVLTESRIRDALLASLDGAGVGDRIDIAMFYFSHRPLVDALLGAHRRGASIRLLMDPNEHAFGRTKNGVPNRPVAALLHRAGIAVRWCDTHGEQCHSKFLLKTGADGQAEMILGSANFTRRNLDNYNLETNVRLLADTDAAIIRDAAAFFERQWHNEPGRHFSVPYARYADESLWRRWQYRVMEATGLSTF